MSWMNCVLWVSCTPLERVRCDLRRMKPEILVLRIAGAVFCSRRCHWMLGNYTQHAKPRNVSFHPCLLDSFTEQPQVTGLLCGSITVAIPVRGRTPVRPQFDPTLRRLEKTGAIKCVDASPHRLMDSPRGNYALAVRNSVCSVCTVRSTPYSVLQTSMQVSSCAPQRSIWWVVARSGSRGQWIYVAASCARVQIAAVVSHSY